MKSRRHVQIPPYDPNGITSNSDIFITCANYLHRVAEGFWCDRTQIVNRPLYVVACDHADVMEAFKIKRKLCFTALAFLTFIKPLLS